MRFFGSVFWLQLKRLVRRPFILACLLALPCAAVALGLALGGGQPQDPVRVGVWLPDTPAGQALWQNLGAQQGGIVFERATGLAQAEEMVAAGGWECAYVAAEDFDERISEGRYTRLFTRVDSPATTLGRMVNWTVAAALLDVCAPALAERYLEDKGLLDAYPGGRPAFEELLQQAFGGDAALMEITVTPVGGPAPGDGAAQDGGAYLRGLAALLLMLLCCLCAVRFSQDNTGGLFARMRSFVHPAALFVPGYLAAGALCLAAGGLAIGLGALFFPGYFHAPLLECAALLLYVLYLGCFSFFLASLFGGPGGRPQLLVCALPFLMVACLLFTPIVIDLSQFFSAGRYISPLLPPTLYLRAAAGRTAAFWQMPLASAVWALLGLGLNALRGRILRGFSLARAPR